MGILTTPISSVVLLFDVSFKPAMRVGGMQEIDLTPFQRRLRVRCRVLRIWLHPTDIACEDYVVFQGPIAAVSIFAGRRRSHQGRDRGKSELPHVCVYDVRCATGYSKFCSALYLSRYVHNCALGSSQHGGKDEDMQTSSHVWHSLAGKISNVKPNDKATRKLGLSRATFRLQP
jgi:hypothetical protein